MSRHSLLTHAFVPYFRKDDALSEDEKRLHRVVLAIKNGGNVIHSSTGVTASATQSLVNEYGGDDPRSGSIFAGHRTAVPIPSSSVLGPRTRQQWPCLDIGERFAERGFVKNARPILTRQTPIVKSHLVASSERPSVEDVAHSLTVDRPLLEGVEAITLIDDVVSSGTNAMGAFIALRRAGFKGDVVVFAVAYTVEAGAKAEPFFGEIVWLEGKKVRSFRPTPDPGWFERTANYR